MGDTLRTPYFLVDEGLLKKNLEILRQVAQEAGCKILLAQKAFSMFACYPLISRYLSGTTASGLFEARLGREEFPGEVHVFSPAYREEELDELQKQQVCGLVLDLRNNNSGTVERMVESCQKLLPAGNVAQYVNNTGETVVEYTAGSGRIALPLTVVVNDSTYGAAEVLAAAIRDGKGGTLVGSETAGAASKQETIQLSDGSALILTVGYYVDAQGNSLYETGVAPDREIHLGVLQERVLLRELLDPMEDPQVQSAVTALIEEGAAVQQVPGSSSDDSSES